MEILLPDNHITLSSSTIIRDICQPLVRTFNTKTFSYVKINPDLSRVHFETHDQWTKLFYQKFHQYYLAANSLQEAFHWESGYAPLQSAACDECLKDGSEFNIGQGIVLSKHEQGCTELAFFGLQTDSPNLDYIKLLNNIDLLEKFVCYFRDQAQPLIQQAEKSPIVIPFLKDTQVKYLSIGEQATTFLNDISIDSIKLTHRETQCLQLITQGYTSKEIARKLNISFRTVEHHTENIKKKSGLKRKADLWRLPHW